MPAQHTMNNKVVGLTLLCSCASPVLGSWWTSDSGSGYSTTKYGSSVDRDWLYNSKSISMKLEGCILGYNTADSEDAGCPENESEDGTVYWYQMANCLRPQAVFSLYASDSGSTSCSSNTFKESVSFGNATLHWLKFEISIPIPHCFVNSPLLDIHQCQWFNDWYYWYFSFSSSQRLDLENFSTTCHNTMGVFKTKEMTTIAMITLDKMEALASTTCPSVKRRELVPTSVLDAVTTENSSWRNILTKIAFNRRAIPRISPW